MILIMTVCDFLYVKEVNSALKQEHQIELLPFYININENVDVKLLPFGILLSLGMD